MGCTSSTDFREAAAFTVYAGDTADARLRALPVLGAVGTCHACGKLLSAVACGGGPNAATGPNPRAECAQAAAPVKNVNSAPAQLTRAFELPCGHLFHESCIETALAAAPCCPVCAADAHPRLVPAYVISAAAVADEMQRRQHNSQRRTQPQGQFQTNGDAAASPTSGAAANVGVPFGAGLAATPIMTPTEEVDPSAGNVYPSDSGSTEGVAAAFAADDDADADVVYVPRFPPVDGDETLLFQPTSTFADGCGLCCNPTRGGAGAEPLVLLRCGHVFHAACADEWLAATRHCPTCDRQHSAIVGVSL